MNTNLKDHLGRRRRSLVAVMSVALVAALFAVAAINTAGATTSATGNPPPVTPPNEAATQLTVNIAADGNIALPFRQAVSCQSVGAACTGSYTTIAPGRVDLVLHDPSGADATISFQKWNGKAGSHQKNPKKQFKLAAGQTLLTVTHGSHVAQLVVWATSVPYGTPTTSVTPTTLAADSHVTVTLDNNGVHASPSSVPAGNVDIKFLDARGSTAGNPGLYLEVLPLVGTHKVVDAGGETVTLLCAHDWILRVIYQNGDVTTTTISPGYTGPTTILHVTGTYPSCDSPVTTVPSTTPTTVRGHGMVVVTLDDSGLHADPSSMPSGQLDMFFVDNRSDTSGSPVLYREVQPGIGRSQIAGAGQEDIALWCPHTWILRVIFEGSTNTSTSLAGGLPGPYMLFDTTGTTPLCTTPVT